MCNIPLMHRVLLVVDCSVILIIICIQRHVIVRSEALDAVAQAADINN